MMIDKNLEGNDARHAAERFTGNTKLALIRDLPFEYRPPQKWNAGQRRRKQVVTVFPARVRTSQKHQWDRGFHQRSHRHDKVNSDQTEQQHGD